MSKPTFSPTKFETYLRCPLQYRLAYIDKLSRRYGRARAGYALGGSVHRALQALHEQGGADAVTADQLLQKFQDTWTHKGFASQEEERAHFEAGQGMILEFYNAAKEQPSETLLTEKMLKQDRGRYVLTGKIDRLDRLPDGSLEVIDYKSGRSSLEESDVAGELALMVYETVVRSLYPDTPVRVALLALRVNLKVSILRTPEESKEAEKFLDALAHEIMVEDTFPGRMIENCPDCDFRRVCPAYRRPLYPTIPA
jgi:RecB family exonuclease